MPLYGSSGSSGVGWNLGVPEAGWQGIPGTMLEVLVLSSEWGLRASPLIQNGSMLDLLDHGGFPVAKPGLGNSATPVCLGEWSSRDFRRETTG